MPHTFAVYWCRCRCRCRCLAVLAVVRNVNVAYDKIISLFWAWWFDMRWTFCYLFMHVVSINGLVSRILNFEYFGTHTGNTRLWGWRHQPEVRSRHISVYVPGHSEHQDHASEAEESLTGGMSVLARSTVQVWMDRCLHEYKQIDGINLMFVWSCIIVITEE